MSSAANPAHRLSGGETGSGAKESLDLRRHLECTHHHERLIGKLSIWL
jgi:hypothetical protein